MWSFQENIFRTNSIVAGPDTTLDIDSTEIDAGSCTNCRTVTVNVSPGSTIQVETIKTGLAPYSGTISACSALPPGAVSIISDVVLTITATTTYKFGISASVGNGAGSTSIQFSIFEMPGHIPIDSTILNRTHGIPIGPAC